MLKLIRNFSKKDWMIVLLCIILISFQVWLDLRLPEYMSTITVLIQKENNNMSEILKNGGFMLICAFGSLISAIIVGYLTSKLSQT